MFVVFSLVHAMKLNAPSATAKQRQLRQGEKEHVKEIKPKRHPPDLVNPDNISMKPYKTR